MTYSQELLAKLKKANDDILLVRNDALVLISEKIDKLAQSYKEYCERQKIDYDFEKRAINLLTPLIHIDNTDDPWQSKDVRAVSLWTDFLEVELDDPNGSDPVPIDDLSTTNIILIISDLEVMIANPYKVTFFKDGE